MTKRNTKKSRKIIAETNIKKEYLKRFLYLLGGLLLIALVWEEKGIVRFIGIVGLIVCLAQIVAMFSMLQLLLDDFFPPKTYDKTKTNTFDKFIYYLSGTLFFCGIIFEIFEIRKIDNTIGGLTLFWKAGFVGVIISISLLLVFKKISPTIYDESQRRISILASFILGSFIFSPAFASFINHHYSTDKIECKNYNIKSKSIGGKRNKSSWLFLEIETNKEERFDVTRSLYDQVQEGGQVKLCTKKGKLGYEIVEEFKTID